MHGSHDHALNSLKERTRGCPVGWQPASHLDGPGIDPILPLLTFVSSHSPHVQFPFSLVRVSVLACGCSLLVCASLLGPSRGAYGRPGPGPARLSWAWSFNYSIRAGLGHLI